MPAGSSFLLPSSDGLLSGIGQTIPGKCGTLLATAVWMLERESVTESSSDPFWNSEGVVLRIRRCSQPSRGISVTLGIGLNLPFHQN
jgi:hypothetical protein